MTFNCFVCSAGLTAARPAALLVKGKPKTSTLFFFVLKSTSSVNRPQEASPGGRGISRSSKPQALLQAPALGCTVGVSLVLRARSRVAWRIGPGSHTSVPQGQDTDSEGCLSNNEGQGAHTRWGQGVEVGECSGLALPWGWRGQKRRKRHVYEELVILLGFWAQTSISSNASP